MRGRLIGFGHRARVGKDTAVEGLGWHRLALADSVRKLLYDMDPMVFGNLRLSSLVDDVGWENAKDAREVRRLLQQLGNGARQHLGVYVWLDPLIVRISGLRDAGVDVAVADVRYPNECEAIQEMGGLMVRIDRPSVPLLDHPSECALDEWTGWDAVITNDGSVTDLVDAIRVVVDGP